jgi:hypothetical protein
VLLAALLLPPILGGVWYLSPDQVRVRALIDAYRMVLLTLGTVTDGDQKREPRTVHYSDIPGRVQIIGKLGQPVGQPVTVRARWTAPRPSKPALPVFMVNQVNGRPLDPPAQFDDVEAVWGKGEEVTKRAVGDAENPLPRGRNAVQPLPFLAPNHEMLAQHCCLVGKAREPKGADSMSATGGV